MRETFSLRVWLCILAIALTAQHAIGQESVAADDPPPEWGAAEYRIGIEDVLQIFVWGEPDLTLSVKVRPDGRISYPLIHEIEVDGLSPREVRDEITTRLADYVREPAVTVIVQEINSFRVYVLGEVNQQGALNFHGPTRLLQAVASSGGLTEFSKKKIVLLRGQGDAELRIPIDYKRVVGGSEQNLYLRPGDTLLVE